MKEFLNYYKVLISTPKLKNLPIGTVIGALGVYLVNILSTGTPSYWFPFVATVVLFLGIILFCSHSSPNMEAALPITRKKKLLFRFLSLLLSFLIALTVAFIAIDIMYFIICICYPDYFENYVDYASGAFEVMGVYGGLFGLAYIIIMYSSGMIVGFIKRNRNRNIFLASLCGGLFISYLITAHIYNKCRNNGYYKIKLLFSHEYFEVVGMPWLHIAFWFLIAFVFLGFAIYLGVKYYAPKKF